MRADAALVVVLGGVSAAAHVGKLPPALPVLQSALGIGLVEAGFLLSLVQLAGMTLGLLAGLAADGLGLRRVMAGGLALLGGASLAGSLSTTPSALLAWRAVEGLGFLMASMPAPALLRRLVPPARLSRAMGWWGAYMPIGTATAFLAGPAVLAAVSWQAWWVALGALSLAMAGWLWRAIPAMCDEPAGPRSGLAARARRTLGARGPWLGAITFGMYSAQWLAVIGFLPTVYAQAGLPAAWSAAATALAAGVNLVGNVAAGRLMHAGWAPRRLLLTGFAAMLVGAALAFGAGSPGARYAGVMLFSMVGGLVPATLFALSVRLAPEEGALAATVGWMQQGSALGQFAGPPLVAWFAASRGGWTDAGWITGAFAIAGALLALLIARHPGGSSARADAT